MEVNVHNCLAGTFSAIVDRSVSAAYAGDLSCLSNSLGNLSRIKSALRITSEFINIGKMFLRNYKNMYRSCSINILEVLYIIVLIYFC